MIKKILIIDDNQGDIYLIKDLFSQKGFEYEVLWADNEMEGLGIAQNEKPDAVFLDVNLPLLNGYIISKKLRSLGNANLHIIIMSGIEDLVDQQKAQECLADDFCTKQPESMLSAMLRCQQKGSSAKEKRKKIDILLVEDNKGDQILFEEAFKDTALDINLTILDRGDKVVEYALNTNPQFIFMDIMMPGISGSEVVKLLKDDIRTKSIPVVFLTGVLDKQEELNNKGINIEEEFYPALAKPINKQRLSDIVKKVHIIGFQFD